MWPRHAGRQRRMRPVAWPFHRARPSSGAQRVATRYFRTNAGWRACASSHPVSPQHRLRARLARGCEARPFDVSSQIARNVGRPSRRSSKSEPILSADSHRELCSSATNSMWSGWSRSQMRPLRSLRTSDRIMRSARAEQRSAPCAYPAQGRSSLRHASRREWRAGLEHKMNEQSKFRAHSPDEQSHM